jgi:polar amino acid transport system substrate-binding protein
MADLCKFGLTLNRDYFEQAQRCAQGRWGKLAHLIFSVDMIPKSFLVAGSAALVLATPTIAHAESVIEKVARTEVLTVGIRFDAVPYSYIDADGNLVGYSIDIFDRIEAQLEAELGKDIVVQKREANDPAERIPLITSGEIDIACDTRFTWERDRYVDYSISYSLSGIRFITLANSTLDTIESLSGQNVAVLKDSIGEATVELVQPGANLMPVETAEAAFDALEAGQVDAIAGDTVVLAGLAARRGTTNYRIAPDVPLQRFGIACMVPENNSTFLNLVNYSIAGLLQGYVSGEQEALNTVNQWIGEDGIVPLPEELVRTFFAMVLAQRAQVPPSAN